MEKPQHRFLQLPHNLKISEKNQSKINQKSFQNNNNHKFLINK